MDSLAPHLPLISRVLGGLVLLWIGYGLLKRRDPKVHIPVMVSAFILDVANVVIIELNRKAIERTLETAAAPGEWILKFHIAVSVIALVCYVIALITGPLVLKRGRCRGLHFKNAVVFLVCRVLNFITSFMV
jgi:formate-dependent nitrite reductase membrane component NrfD